MTDGPKRTALDAVNSARPIVARLSATRDKEDLAADIIEAWTAVETGLRSLIGGSPLTGQALIRELRQRQLLNLEQANALAEFHAARERSGRTEYTPTEHDINATRDAFLKLESGLMSGPEGDKTVRMSILSKPTESMPKTEDFLVASPQPAKSRPAWLIPVLVVVGLIVVTVGAWWAIAGRGDSDTAYAQGVTAYREGRREAAQGAFHKAAIEAPNDPMPHVYLSRMEREQGNLNNANAEAVKAVQLGPDNNAALRELASVLFAEQNFDGARTFFIRAIKADSTDRLSQGFLGCTMVRLGRVEEGVKWIGRAGTGAWSSCAPAAGTPPPIAPPR